MSCLRSGAAEFRIEDMTDDLSLGPELGLAGSTVTQRAFEAVLVRCYIMIVVGRVGRVHGPSLSRLMDQY